MDSKSPVIRLQPVVWPESRQRVALSLKQTENEPQVIELSRHLARESTTSMIHRYRYHDALTLNSFHFRHRAPVVILVAEASVV